MRASLRRLLRAAPLAAAWLLAPVPAWACAACYGQADGPMIDAARVAIFFMLVVVAGLQVAFAAFFLHLRRQARRAQETAAPPAVGQPQPSWR